MREKRGSIKHLTFCYTLDARYSAPVWNHSFRLLFLPRDTQRQRITQLHTEISGCPNPDETTDPFGNRKLYGCVQEPHDAFSIRVSGMAETGLDIFGADAPDPMSAAVYKIQTPLTQPGTNLQAFHQGLGLTPSSGDYEKALETMRALHAAFQYQPGATAIHEPAEAAFTLGHGVCQDYAHILLSLLRLEGIPARYVVGMTVGEGASHAWVEALCQGCWYGLDPTGCKLVDDTYIQVSWGRDSEDCSIIRGTFYGMVSQLQQERVRVEEACP